MALEVDKEWRKKEESLQDIIKKYPTVSPFIIIATDVQRRGVDFTDAALAKVNQSIHQLNKEKDPRKETREAPASLLLRDGTSIIVHESRTRTQRDPYIVDAADDKIVLVDQDQVIEEAEYWQKPEFFDKFTSRGTPMSEVVGARPQRFNLLVNKCCHFWDQPGHGCKYCAIGANGVKFKDSPNELINLDDVRETVQELIKEKGRYVGICLTGGSVLSGNELLDDELEAYISVLQAIGSVFKVKRFPVQVNSTAFNRRQLERLYDETGISFYTTDLEVFDEKLYNWICPGKAAYIPFGEWKQRLYDAVDIFGKGNVNTGIVSGVEFAQPNGFQSEEEALKVDLELTEELASNGVGVKEDVWSIAPNSIFFNQSAPSLDYYVRLTKGIYDILKKYDISTQMDNYRRCGMHPNTNLDRI